jgi:predicted  nucleic acid-binding Zn-ribbon protein
MTNYYHEWWEQARNQTGILTKPEYTRLLEQRIKELEAGTTGQAYLALEKERDSWKVQYEKAKKEIQSLDNLLDSLTEENQQKELAKQEAENKLSES